MSLPRARAIRREYLDAGADLVGTLTFGANRVRLDGVGRRRRPDG